MHAPVAYDDVARELAAHASTVHPSEAHGCLCGALCTSREYSRDEWLAEIVESIQGEPEAAGGALATLFEASTDALAGGELDFQPLLPDDETALGPRVEALAAWCAGFLYGFGTAGGPAANNPVPAEVSEVIADFARIAQAGAPDAEEPEEDEAAYAELVEFLRAAVQLVYEELNAPRRLPRAGGHAH
jgi:uncharacterized protein YgfB (UPF0149 family)